MPLTCCVCLECCLPFSVTSVISTKHSKPFAQIYLPCILNSRSFRLMTHTHTHTLKRTEVKECHPIHHLNPCLNAVCLWQDLADKVISMSSIYKEWPCQSLSVQMQQSQSILHVKVKNVMTHSIPEEPGPDIRVRRWSTCHLVNYDRRDTHES